MSRRPTRSTRTYTLFPVTTLFRSLRHESFLEPRFIASMREAGVAVVFADKPKYPQIADITTDFVYARLRDAREEEAEGYSPQALDRWVSVTRAWSEGERPAGVKERKSTRLNSSH